MKLDLDRTAAVIRDSGADIVLLQEVDDGTRRSGGRDQAAVLAATSGLRHFVYGKNLDFQGGGYGNAILSRLPLSEVRNEPIPPLPVTLETRGVLLASVEAGGKRLRLMNSHFPLTAGERVEAARVVLGLVDQAGGPVVFGGDLNATDDSPEVIALTQRLKDAAPRPAAGTYPADQPECRIDYLFYSAPLAAARFSVIDTQASDHLPVLIELLPW